MNEETWPFLHLNLVSPPRPTSTQLASPTPLPSVQLNNNLSLFDSAQLDAWTNINFSFDEIPPNNLFNHPPFDDSNLPKNDSNPPFSLNCSSPISASTDHEHHHPFWNHPLIMDHQSPSSISSHDLIPGVITSASSASNSHFKSNEKSSTVSDCALPNQQVSNPLLTPFDSSKLNPSVNPSPNHSSSNNNNSKSARTNSSNSEDQHQPQTHPDSSPTAVEEDEANRIAVEDDKRRRNTLASARFRMKKKMKEQEIERTAKEMKERVFDLEQEVKTLKQENQWLRGLILDQANSKSLQKDSAQIVITSTLSADSEVRELKRKNDTSETFESIKLSKVPK